jgi:putative ABC transport system permease protein
VAAIAGALVLQDPIMIPMLVGMLLILGGVTLARRSAPRPLRPSAAAAQCRRGVNMDTFWLDLQVAFRQCRRRPGFVLTVVSTLALTIGATTAVFAVVNAVLLRALPFAAPERLVYITSVRPDYPAAPFSLPEYMDYRQQARSLAGIAAYANWSASMAAGGVMERFQGARMSANAFDVLGVKPAAGRLLRDSDDRADAPPVAVLSYRLWQRLFGGAPEVVGRSVRINTESYVIAGVLPRQFPLPLRDIDVVVPLVPDRDPYRHARSSTNFLRLIGRLKSGVSSQEAQAELTSICLSLRKQFPVEYARKDAVHTASLQDALVGDHRRPMFLLLASVVLVLGAALANLLSLLLVRTAERSGELSVRVALGASRSHLIRQLSLEALLLTLAGGGLGCVLAAWAGRAALAWAPASIPRAAEVGVDASFLLFALGLTSAAAILFAIVPMSAVFRARAGAPLPLASRGAVGDRRGRGMRDALVVSEISAALVLLLATGLLVQSLLRLQRVPLGFHTGGVFQARVTLPPAYRSPEDLARFDEQLTSRLASSPTVGKVGLISAAPLSGVLVAVPFTVEGQPPPTERDVATANLRVITPGYMAAAGTRLVRGRGFAETDRANMPAVALVSEALARRFLAGEPVGQRLLIDDNSKGPRPVEIVGVVENVTHTALDGPPSVDVYIPLRQIHPEGVPLLRNNQFWIVRLGTEPGDFRMPFLTELRAVDPDAAISSTGSMGQYLDAWLAPRRFSLGLFVAFSAMVVLLALSGLYGLVSYTVNQRRREIAVRMAVGATPRDVQRLILRQAARFTIAGAALGLGVAAAGRPLLTGIVEVTSAGSLVWLGATLALVGVVTLAGWLPARRAARVEPTAALRGE